MTEGENPQSNTGEMERNQELAAELNILQARKNDGRGVGFAQTIMAFLSRNRKEEARAVCFNEFDKLASYPDISEWARKNLFSEDEESPWKMSERFRQQAKD